jgi:hypothetical protein
MRSSASLLSTTANTTRASSHDARDRDTHRAAALSWVDSRIRYGGIGGMLIVVTGLVTVTRRSLRSGTNCTEFD